MQEGPRLQRRSGSRDGSLSSENVGMLVRVGPGVSGSGAGENDGEGGGEIVASSPVYRVN